MKAQDRPIKPRKIEKGNGVQTRLPKFVQQIGIDGLSCTKIWQLLNLWSYTVDGMRPKAAARRAASAVGVVVF